MESKGYNKGKVKVTQGKVNGYTRGNYRVHKGKQRVHKGKV